MTATEKLALGARPAERDIVMCKSILVIAPNDLMRASLRAILSGDGHQVQTSGDLSDAPRLLSGASFEVVFANSNCPDGLANLLHLKLQFPKLRLVLMTSCPAEKAPENTIVLSKPFSLSDIRAAAAGTGNKPRRACIGGKQLTILSSFLSMATGAAGNLMAASRQNNCNDWPLQSRPCLEATGPPP
jgi:CheY-like chemotaxis protein